MSAEECWVQVELPGVYCKFCLARLVIRQTHQCVDMAAHAKALGVTSISVSYDVTEMTR